MLLNSILVVQQNHFVQTLSLLMTCYYKLGLCVKMSVGNSTKSIGAKEVKVYRADIMVDEIITMDSRFYQL